MGNIQKDFKAVLDSYVAKPITMSLLDRLYYDIRSILSNYDLKAVKFTLQATDEGTISILPLDTISRYALLGVFTTKTVEDSYTINRIITLTNARTTK